MTAQRCDRAASLGHIVQQMGNAFLLVSDRRLTIHDIGMDARAAPIPLVP